MSEFEVGDWITILDDSQGWIAQVTGIQSSLGNASGFTSSPYKKELLIFEGGYLSSGWARHATPEEIKAGRRLP